MADVGRMLLVFGIVLLVIGGALMLFGRFHLPGDFTFRRGTCGSVRSRPGRAS